MPFNDIYVQFALCKSWEERYRLLIQLSRQLPKPTEQQLASWQEIHGCESRLWFDFQLEPRKVQGYSDARLMQGLLVILIAYLNEQSAENLQQFDIQQLFDELQITRHLTSTRLNGLQQLQSLIRAKSTRSI
ncbi:MULTISPECIES: SufE family protein [Glaesserella]|uniref:Fe-S metabolism associated domain-containing protein n=1 Tax=Glaesserella australis TaxID=2094024 RepID=A0A328C0H9_9PAST|nr:MULTISPECIES: SufE family protein [Glaesserella]AUI66425.1 hypothetical protein CJD39_07430 [Glaesserella sp. 15-184]RAL19361.1 hypothetical protein C5N92_02635 [Glaesserella australis]